MQIFDIIILSSIFIEMGACLVVYKKLISFGIFKVIYVLTALTNDKKVYGWG